MTIERRASDRGRHRGGVLGRVPVGILTSPFQWVVAVLSATLAVAVPVDRLLGETGALPLPLVFAWGVLLLTGGSVTAVAMLLPRTSRVVATEIAALVLLATGWLVYSGGYVLTDNRPVGPILVGPALALASALRVLAIVITGRVLLHVGAIKRELDSELDS